MDDLGPFPGELDERPDGEGEPLIFVRRDPDDAEAEMLNSIETGLRGTLIEGYGFVVPFTDWATAEECLRIVRADVVRTRDGGD